MYIHVLRIRSKRENSFICSDFILELLTKVSHTKPICSVGMMAGGGGKILSAKRSLSGLSILVRSRHVVCKVG